jgi:hypothetical protein
VRTAELNVVRASIVGRALACPECPEMLAPPPGSLDCPDCGWPTFQRAAGGHADFCRCHGPSDRRGHAVWADVLQRHLYERHRWPTSRLNAARFDIRRSAA